MSIRIPYLAPVNGSSGTPTMNASGSSAVAGGVQNVSEGLSAAGGALFEVNEKLQRIKNDGKLSDLKAQAKQTAMEYQATLATNKDPSSWGPGFEKKMTEFTSGMKIENLPPDVRDAYNQWEKDFTSSQSLSLQRDANIYSINQATLAKKNSVGRSMDMEDWGAARSEVESDPYASPEEKKQSLYQIDQKEAQSDVQKLINQDPAEAQKYLSSDDFLKQSGNTSELKEWGLNQARIAGNRRSAEVFDEGMNAVYRNQLITDDDLKKYEPKIGAYGVARLKQTRDNLRSDEYKRRSATPEFQNELAGKSSASIEALTGAKDFSRQYSEASYNVDQMADSPLKRYYQDKLSAAKKGETARIDTADKSALKAIEDIGKKAEFVSGTYAKQGELGSVNADGQITMRTQRLINDGFLRDPKKLSAWFDEDQVKAITGQKDDNDRKAKFQELWVSGKGKGGASEFDQQAAEAILDGVPEITYATPETTRQAAKTKVEIEDRKGKMLQELNTYLISNPSASPDEIEKKVFEISGAAGRDAYLESRAKPTVKAEEGDRITSYGYAADTTPDSNSKAGIGAWVGDEEAARIKMGESTPSRLKEGDLAVSRDVERQFKAAGISPMDTVTVTLDDGTTHTGRWMDRTAESYGGKSLTGRFDIYSPKGKNPLDGKRVVGWSGVRYKPE